jgi:hypothetical protein
MDIPVPRLGRSQHLIEGTQPLLEQIPHQLGAFDETTVAHFRPIDMRILTPGRASDAAL